jgi:hypothetical protein
MHANTLVALWAGETGHILLCAMSQSPFSYSGMVEPLLAVNCSVYLLLNSHVSFTHKTYDEITQLYICYSNRSFHILFSNAYQQNSVKKTTCLTMGISHSAKEFYKNLNFSNCEVCIYGKHIKAHLSLKLGSMYCNYRQYHSITLQSVADA